jgi:MSHA biogenesis protein MshN
LVALFIRDKRYTEASRYLNQGLLLTPNHVSFVKLKARLLMIKGNNRGALATLAHVSPPLSNDTEYYVLTALLQQRLNQPVKAARTYERLLRYNSSQSVWWMGLGVSLESAQQSSAAAQAYQQAINTGHLNARLKTYVRGRLKAITG